MTADPEDGAGHPLPAVIEPRAFPQSQPHPGTGELIWTCRDIQEFIEAGTDHSNWIKRALENPRLILGVNIWSSRFLLPTDGEQSQQGVLLGAGGKQTDGLGGPGRGGHNRVDHFVNADGMKEICRANPLNDRAQLLRELLVETQTRIAIGASNGINGRGAADLAAVLAGQRRVVVDVQPVQPAPQLDGEVIERTDEEARAMLPAVYAGDGTKPHRSGRALQAFVGNTKAFTNWAKDWIKKFGWLEGRDFVIVFCVPQQGTQNEDRTDGRGGHNKVDYLFTDEACVLIGIATRGEIGDQLKRVFAAKVAGQVAHGKPASISQLDVERIAEAIALRFGTQIAPNMAALADVAATPRG